MKKKDIVDLIFNPKTPLLVKYKTVYINKKIVEDLILFEKQILNLNFEMRILSCHRSFIEQSQVWNEKVLGKRDVLNEQSQKINIDLLNEEELFFSILNWSAFPGLSRHHFGTDMDIADHLYLKTHPNYKIQLIDPEYLSENGVFKNFYNIIKENHSNFYFPYQKNLGGIKPEPWHISHLSSKDIINIYSYDLFLDLLKSENYKDILLMNIAKKYSKILYHKYFLPIINI